MLFASWQS